MGAIRVVSPAGDALFRGRIRLGRCLGICRSAANNFARPGWMVFGSGLLVSQYSLVAWRNIRAVFDTLPLRISSGPSGIPRAAGQRSGCRPFTWLGAYAAIFAREPPTSAPCHCRWNSHSHDGNLKRFRDSRLFCRADSHHGHFFDLVGKL